MRSRWIYVWLLGMFLAGASPVLGQLGSHNSLGGFGGGDLGGPTVTSTAEFVPAAGSQPAQLMVTATVKSGWHIFSITQPEGGPVRTQIELTPSDRFKLTGEFHPTAEPDRKKEPLFNNITVETHDVSVTWVAPLELSPGVDAATLKITGKVRAQACKGLDACEPPTDFPFVAQLGHRSALTDKLAAGSRAAPPSVPARETSAVVPPGAASMAPPPPLHSTMPPSPVASMGPPPPASSSAPPAPSNSGPPSPATSMAPPAPVSSTAGPPLPAAAGTAAQAGAVQAGPPPADAPTVNGSENIPLWSALGLGFLGGLILNIMPCVLPVIGLKILGFVEQSGDDRSRIFALNAWYAAGVIAFFMVLAGLTVALGLGWGELFGFQGFQVTIAVVVFVMALSLLGVWEVPIPGFLGRGPVDHLAQKEGASGAFAKGVLTTILATPCGAPYLASAVNWAVRQPPATIFSIFLAAGLGMASPYLLIGAYPGLLRFLPKPGAWMETFKQFMGFVLLGTVVFFLTFVPFTLVVPTVGLMFGLWLSCWWIGRMSPLAEPGTKARTWIEAAAIGAVAWAVCFHGGQGVLPEKYTFSLAAYMQQRWDRANDGFSRERLERLVAARKTVLVDFTADWCVSCKFFEKTILDTDATRQAIAEHRVVTMRADWTNRDPEVTEMLKWLGSKQVPVIAIFPAGDFHNPIVFRGGYTQQDLIDAIAKAGRSKS